MEAQTCVFHVTHRRHDDEDDDDDDDGWHSQTPHNVSGIFLIISCKYKYALQVFFNGMRLMCISTLVGQNASYFVLFP